MDPSPLELVLLVGLTARLVRLAVVDDIARPARDLIRAAGDRLAPRRGRGLVWADSLVTCPFCIGFWISVATVIVWLQAGHTLVYQAAALAGTLSYVVGHAVATLDLNAGE